MRGVPELRSVQGQVLLAQLSDPVQAGHQLHSLLLYWRLQRNCRDQILVDGPTTANHSRVSTYLHVHFAPRP